MWRHPFFFVLISSKSIDTIRASFGLGFYGSFLHKPGFLLNYFPQNVPISCNTSVKNANITPKSCHIVFIKFNVANSIKSITFFKKTGKNTKNKYNILKFRKYVMGELFV